MNNSHTVVVSACVSVLCIVPIYLIAVLITGKFIDILTLDQILTGSTDMPFDLKTKIMMKNLAFI